jgi:hypothetical protein
MIEWHSKNDHPMLGKKQTEETKRRIGIAAKKTASAPVCMYTKEGTFIRSFDSMGAGC